MTLGLSWASKLQTPATVTNFCGALFFFMVHWPPVQEERDRSRDKELCTTGDTEEIPFWVKVSVRQHNFISE